MRDPAERPAWANDLKMQKLRLFTMGLTGRLAGVGHFFPINEKHEQTDAHQDRANDEEHMVVAAGELDEPSRKEQQASVVKVSNKREA